MPTLRRLLPLIAAALLVADVASADEPAPPPADAAPAPEATPAPAAAPDPAPAHEVVPAEHPSRKEDLKPAPSEPPPAPPATGGLRFTADPVGDGALIALAASFGALSNLVLSTDEIRPQQISPTFRTSQLLGVDRIAVRQTRDPNAALLSDVGMLAAVAYGVTDTVLDGFRVGRSAALVEAVMYAETFLITQGVVNVAKIAFRRPRPRAYMDRDAYLRGGGDPATYDNASVDSSLSFPSGHVSRTAAFGAAATYIAFSRAPKSARPWLTLAGGTLLTAFVGYERVRDAAHFPTDVIAGALIGAGVGGLVVHTHREDSVKQRPVWIGFTPVHEGGMLGASGVF